MNQKVNHKIFFENLDEKLDWLKLEVNKLFDKNLKPISFKIKIMQLDKVKTIEIIDLLMKKAFAYAYIKSKNYTKNINDAVLWVLKVYQKVFLKQNYYPVIIADAIWLTSINSCSLVVYQKAVKSKIYLEGKQSYKKLPLYNRILEFAEFKNNVKKFYFN